MPLLPMNYLAISSPRMNPNKASCVTETTCPSYDYPGSSNHEPGLLFLGVAEFARIWMHQAVL